MEEKNKSPTAIIVGAGAGGIALAARLAHAGVRVTLLEKNDYTGGRCSVFEHDGHRFDRGPTLLLLPHIFHTTFSDLGTSLSAEGIQLIKCEPNYVVRFADGEQMELSTDLARMKAEVERWEGKDGFESYLGFLAEAHRHYELSVIHVLQRNFPSLLAMLRPSFLMHVFALHPFTSLYSRASKYFRTERLRRAFTFAAMYMGMSPFSAPATYSLLQYTELAEGIYYPLGGMYAIFAALVRIFLSHPSSTLRLSCLVNRVLVSSEGKAEGVELESGEKLYADIVIINADLVWASANLLPSSPVHTAAAAALSSRPASCSSVSFYWSLSRPVPQLGAHTVFLADSYKDSFDAIFERHDMPEELSFYVHVPSRIDPAAAPPGKESVVVLVPVGHLREEESTSSGGGIRRWLNGQKGDGIPETQDWDTLVNRAREQVFARLAQVPGLEKFGELLVHESVYTPVDWKSEYNLDKGAILGIAHDFFNVLSFRPTTRHPTIKSLYFVGASTHPGTGVPIVLAGAKLTADQVLSQLNLPIPWQVSPGLASSKHSGSKLDVPRRRMGGEWWMWALVAICLMCGIYWTRVAQSLSVR